MNLTTLVVVHTVCICVTVGLLVAVIMTAFSNSSCSHKKIRPKQRIVGGKPVKIKDFPFMAGIIVKKHGAVLKDSLQCGSSIISSKWVVTAAHCISLLEEQGFDKDLVYISTGNSMWSYGKKHTILDWTYHDKFDQQVMNDDIALIRAKEPFVGPLSHPVPVASRKYIYKSDSKVKIIGWGLTATGASDVQKTLRGVDVILYNQTYCKQLYKAESQVVTGSMFCAGVTEGGKDACQFDSGGPIFDGNLQIGIVSWGIECGEPGKPGVYTKLWLYQQWIVTQTKRLHDPISATFKDKP